ncbi:thioredoxin domain-containing protein [Vibrio sp. SCSIO 43137]|uniref:thioredoxin domain-containing protein n=1 Tax=Vibrio sp. SCSIO 43137 TaxID=3021011 RepID=UPI002307EDE5|nr:thioredoxin domain-containing protein [Vibrio sp. SCSIO 43137]WCE32580.1 thioredoxin domain-containing protein [Vibrio sp. SCSIO 43137]
MLNTSIKALVLLVVTLFVSACGETTTPAAKGAPQLGKHFTALDNDLSAFNLSPITEVFSLTCGHCKNMEQHLPKIEQLTNQKVGKVHVTFNDSAQVSAMFYYAAEMQLNSKPDSNMLAELFDTIQQRDIAMEDRKDRLQKIYTSRGLISPYDLTELQSQEMLNKVNEAADFTEQAKIQAVPSFIIKGKYLLNTEEHENIDQLADTINYILAQASL